MRVEVNPDSCCGSGVCVVSAPEVFGEDEDGLVRLIDPEPAGDLHAQVRQAADRCPTESIRLLEKDPEPEP
ncbi:ferredoxin [Streptosporangium becharense]|uniref:Ferredoxin n=1 Tax=Streptosporangium becharense TaxID=1816182 RepID=A0A7W9IM36_9ACTN|nr:ferredoxin [Streptosporangium becharense]MBB2910444.1 ferredoxin [Streptosporangium becharense]MBB5823187.1 ferredoxin [Streptosporangium becharense]